MSDEVKVVEIDPEAPITVLEQREGEWANITDIVLVMDPENKQIDIKKTIETLRENTKAHKGTFRVLVRGMDIEPETDPVRISRYQIL